MAEKNKKFYEKNTVEIEIGGKKQRVNKFEAPMLKAKLSGKKKADYSDLKKDDLIDLAVKRELELSGDETVKDLVSKLEKSDK